jgi:integrase
MTRAGAQTALERILAEVRLGIWGPKVREQIEQPPEVPTLHEFASQWWARAEPNLAPNTRLDYRWRLDHLLAYFAPYPLDAITYDTVETYIAVKMNEAERIREAQANGKPLTQKYMVGDQQRERAARPLSPRSINMTITLLAAILEGAVERGLIPVNPAKGKARKVKEDPRPHNHLATAAQIEALLMAAEQLDGEASTGRRHIARRAMIATLLFSGLRISELLGLRWADVDLAAGWLKVGESKTPAGRRQVKIRGELRDELASLSANRRDKESAAFLFPTRTGCALTGENFRKRILAPAVKRANENLERLGQPPLPARLTPHGLRHTFCSLLYALGEAPPVVMQEMGHTDPALALKVYAHTMRRGEKEKQLLRALIEGAEWTGIDGNGANTASSPAAPTTRPEPETAS